MKHKALWILLSFFVLGLVLRFWQLGKVPMILNRDEAALAYNALLLKETGKDEWGKSWPLALQSFGDYKLIGYPFATIVSFVFFGYSDWAVKFPSALAGSLLVLIGFLWARKMTHWRVRYALLLAFLLALQPVFFFYSRIAFEANGALTLFFGSLLIYFRPEAAKEKRSKLVFQDFIATVLLLMAVFTYNTPLLLLPFLLPVLVWWRGVHTPRKWGPAFLGMLVVLIIGGISLIAISKQKSGITIFSDEDTWLASVQYHQQFSGVVQKILGNKAVFYTRIIGQHYLETLQPEFLVQKGGAHPWHSLPGWGHIYWVTYILGIIGILGSIWQVFNKKNRSLLDFKFKMLMLYFLFISPLPSVITVDAPHATRSLFFFLIWLLFTVIGSMMLAQAFKRWQLLILIAIVLCESLEASNYMYHYFRDYPHQSTAILRGNYSPAVQAVTQDQAVTKAAVIDDGGYQYILTAWYLKMSPATFFATVQKHLPDKIGFEYGYKVGKFRFIKQPTDRFQDEKTLIEWNPDEMKWKRVDL